jgi:hypothetical protein
MNRWLGPLFVAMIFAFTSIAVVNTLVMIALRRRRELAVLQLVGATRRQVRSTARWEGGLIVTIGLGVGLAIAATRAAAAQPRPDRQPPSLRTRRPHRSHPGHFSPAGAARPGAADPTDTPLEAGRGNRDRGVVAAWRRS